MPDRPVADEPHSFARLELEGVETNVGTVETGLDHHGLSESEVFGYLRDLAGCRGRGERGHHRTGGQFLDELADAQVAGTEVVAPLEHAVGFVHRDQIDPRALREELEVVRPQPFRRDVQQTNLPRLDARVDAPALGRTDAAVDERGLHMPGLQCLDLVAHERAQWGDD